MRLLHVFPGFGVGGAQIRTVAIMNALGRAYSHAILALDGDLSAAARISANIATTRVAPPLARGAILRTFALGRVLAEQRSDLTLTYNWGAIEATAAAVLRCQPVIHTEDGFGPDEADALKRRRMAARRILLNRADCTVVPSRSLLEIARKQFRIAASRVRFIPNGVDTEKFLPGRDAGMRTTLGVLKTDLLIGSVGQLRKEKNLGLLLGAFAAAQLRNAKLVLAGDGCCRTELERLARQLGIAHQVIFAGRVEDPVPYLRALDIFAMSSQTEQMPLALLEAMSCGLPAVCTNVGDSAELLGVRNAPALVPPGDRDALASALRTLADNPRLRASLGCANRKRSMEQYSLGRMVQLYGELYRSAARPGGLWR